jgi:hypothetical protein
MNFRFEDGKIMAKPHLPHLDVIRKTLDALIPLVKVPTEVQEDATEATLRLDKVLNYLERCRLEKESLAGGEKPA